MTDEESIVPEQDKKPIFRVDRHESGNGISINCDVTDREMAVDYAHGTLSIRAKERTEHENPFWLNLNIGNALVETIAKEAIRADPWRVYRMLDDDHLSHVKKKIVAEAIGGFLARKKKRTKTRRLRYSDSTAFQIEPGKWLKTITGVHLFNAQRKFYTGYGLTDEGAKVDMLDQARVDFPDIELWDSTTGEDRMDIHGWHEKEG